MRVAEGSASKRHQLAPLTIALIWWASCFSMFLVGWPIPYVRSNAAIVALLFGACAFMLVLGYRMAMGSPPVHQPLRPRIPWAGVVGALASLALLGPIVNAYSGFALTDVSVALADQGAAFEQGTQRILEGQQARSGLLFVQAALAPLTLIALPVVSLYWFEQRKGLLLFIVVLAVPVVTSVMVGRDQQLGWAALVVGAAWLLSRHRRGLGISWKSLLVLGLTALAFAIAFAARKASRGGPSYFCPPGSRECLFVHAPPNALESATAYFASYAAHGFEGLGRALGTDWTFGGGLSHAPALASFLYNGVPTTVSSQLGEVGWSATWYWSTALTSIANDVPWVLLPVVFFFQGALLARAWRRALAEGDALSVGVFALTWLGVLFTPQNLQLVASGPTYVGYIILVSLFLLRGLVEQWKTSRADVVTTRLARAYALPLEQR